MKEPGLILDLSNPECDVEKYFQQFINRYWDKYGRIEHNFRQQDVWMWVMSYRPKKDINKRPSWVPYSNQTDLFIPVLIDAWKKAGFIEDRKWIFGSPDSNDFKVVNPDLWTELR
jgi:hypothetical protein